MNFFQRFRSQRNSDRKGSNVRMTFAHTSLGRSLSRTSLFLKQQLWAWPIIAALVLSVIGFLMERSIESTMKVNLHSGLKTLLDVETEMVMTWLQVQESNVETQANDQEVRLLVYDLLRQEESAPENVTPPPDAEQTRRKLAKALAPILSSHDYDGFYLADKSQRIIAASNQVLIGQQNVKKYEPYLERTLEGETLVSPPFSSYLSLENASGESQTGVPVMYAFAPIRDEDFQVVAVLALQIDPSREFTRLLQLGQVGESGETYAFNKDGLMVSNSRFDHDLILLGLLPDEPDSRSLLKLHIHDPGGDMTAGFRPAKRRSELPMTRMAATAVTGVPGEDVEGYNDYRGVPVVGAWTWLPRYEMGIATEVDVAQAYRPLFIIKRTFWGLFALLVVAAVAIFVFTVMNARLRREAQKAAVKAQQLGQYTLQKKIGAGAMGEVYQAVHSMLRRPTAVKLLNVDLVNDQSVTRFEREVQITCQLNNPHTIAIYDYGRTPEGVFYYAMEFLDGIDLQSLVDKYGPQPEHRVIHILNQICSSLYEAHSQGLVHRDIKPANIMLNRRGGESDVIKVLDFGLVKALDEKQQANMTSAGSLTGTPLYMSPEAIETPEAVDMRSDLYAVGAVGYFLLTARPVFNAGNLMELLDQQVKAAPVPPSSFAPRPISEAVESALLACLEKSRAKRPQTARDLAELLQRSPVASDWTQDDSDAWWGRHERNQPQELFPASLPPAPLPPAAFLPDPSAPESETSHPGNFDRTYIGED